MEGLRGSPQLSRLREMTLLASRWDPTAMVHYIPIHYPSPYLRQRPRSIDIFWKPCHGASERVSHDRFPRPISVDDTNRATHELHCLHWVLVNS
jgi:hypothetical protein